MRRKNFTSRILLLLAAMLMLAGPALAVTPANTIIENIATLSFDGLASPIEASVDVQVTLLAQAPTLSAPADPALFPGDSTVAENGASRVAYRLTTNANGEDTFDITQTAYTSANLTGDTGSAAYYDPGTTTAVGPITLGATATSASALSTDTTITVPYDGSDDSNVNGLIAGDLVRIGNFDYEIASGGISNDLAGGTSTITLTTGLQENITAGTLVREYQLFDMYIATVGTVTVGGTDAYVDVATSATSQDNNSLSDEDPAHRTNVSSSSFAKYVRNVTTSMDGGTEIPLNGDNFYATGVTAVPGDVLEYALVITTASTGLTDAIVTDTVPAFTLYETGTTYYNPDGTSANTAADVQITDGAGSTLPLIDGETFATIPGNTTWVVKFQVKLEE